MPILLGWMHFDIGSPECIHPLIAFRAQYSPMGAKRRRVFIRGLVMNVVAVDVTRIEYSIIVS